MKTSIIIPVFNEEESIAQTLTELLEFSFPFAIEVIVVNDGSTDSSRHCLDRFAHDGRVKIIHHLNNRGYGASLKEGIKRATGGYVVTYDGDGQFVPADVVRLVNLAEANSLEAIFGERQNLLGGSPLWRAPGKLVIRWVIRLVAGLRIRDFNCGLRVMRTEIIRRYLHVCSDKFSFSMTSMLILISRGYNYMFCPITLRKRYGGKSTVNLMSGINTVYLIIKLIMIFNPLKIFLPSGLALLLLGAVWGGFYVYLGSGLSVGALLLMIAGMLLVFLGLIADQIAELRKSQFET